MKYKQLFYISLPLFVFFIPFVVYAQTNTLTPAPPTYSATIPTAALFRIPPFNEVLSFIIRTFFTVAGLIALLYLLLGAFAWITSGGNKENVDKAREKIQAAIIGLILIIVVLSITILIEQLLFPPDRGLGLSKPIVFDPLVR